MSPHLSPNPVPELIQQTLPPSCTLLWTSPKPDSRPYNDGAFVRSLFFDCQTCRYRGYDVRHGQVIAYAEGGSTAEVEEHLRNAMLARRGPLVDSTLTDPAYRGQEAAGAASAIAA